MTEKQADSNYPLPPIARNLILGRGVEWQHISVDQRLIGRILSYHLVLEHYLNNYLKTHAGDLAWDDARLTFSAKLALLSSPGTALVDAGYLPALRRFNRIRNQLTHDLTVDLTSQDLAALRAVCPKDVLPDEPSVEDILETFTFYVSGWLGGYLAGYHAPPGSPPLDPPSMRRG